MKTTTRIALALLLATTSLTACSAEVSRRGGSGGGGGGGSTTDTGAADTSIDSDTTVDDTGTPGDDTGTTEDTAVDDTGTASDTTPDDTTADTTPDTVDTGTGDTSVGFPCTTNADCIATLGDTFECVSGSCVEAAGPVPCAVDGQACTDPATQQNDTFACVADDTGTGAVCRQFCDADNADATGSVDCPANSYCIDIGTSNIDGLTGACIPGDCTTNIFDTSACSGTGTCLPVGNGASFCITAGTARVGAACNVSTAATPPTSDICARGLLCSNNTCIAPCNRANGNADCGAGESCLGAFDNTPRNRPGLCGQGCNAFSTGTCDLGTSCQPILGRTGLNVWACLAENAGPTYGIGEVCDPTANCAEGSLCIEDDVDALGNPVSHCIQLCSPEEELAGGSPCNALLNPEVCAPSRVAGLGLCNESCTPFPRSPGSTYGCSGTGDGCRPIVLTDTAVTEPRGVCDPNTGTTRNFATCSSSGTFGECLDFGLCYDTSNDGLTNPTCAPLCPPLAQTPICGAGATCSAILPLVGNLAFSVCTRNFNAAAIGARCTTEGDPCTDAGTVCLDTGSGPVCVLACREGYDDCARDAGTTCNTGLLNPDVVPAFMGICL